MLEQGGVKQGKLPAEVGNDGALSILGLPIKKGVLNGGLRGCACVGVIVGRPKLGSQAPWVDAPTEEVARIGTG